MNATEAGPVAARPPAARGEVPSWGAELLQVLAARRGVLVASAVGLSLLGVLVTLVAPGVLPPEPLVGAAVGTAASLLAVAITIAVDAGDAYVGGPRHVRATGATLAGWVPPPGGPQALGALVRDINRAYAAQGGQRVWLVPSTGGDTDVVGTANALANGLCQVGRRVLLIDLVSVETGIGLGDVVRGTHSLGEVVSFDPELLLARAGAGADHEAALQQAAAVIERAPGDVDVLIVALPGVETPGVLAATSGADEVLLLARTGSTSRVELLAGLDALESSGTEVAVLLLDPKAPALPLPATPARAADDPASVASPEPAPQLAPEFAPEPEQFPPAPAVAAPPAVPAAPSPLPPPAPEPMPPTIGIDSLLDVDAAPASGDRFRTALALETLSQDSWRPDDS